MQKSDENAWIKDVNCWEIGVNLWKRLFKCFADVFCAIFFKTVIINHGALTFNHHFYPHLRPTNQHLQIIIPPLLGGQIIKVFSVFCWLLCITLGTCEVMEKWHPANTTYHWSEGVLQVCHQYSLLSHSGNWDSSERRKPYWPNEMWYRRRNLLLIQYN